VAFGPRHAAVAVCALLAHLPALGGWFLQDDWTYLGRALEILPGAERVARPLSQVVGWEVGAALFGRDAPSYHGAALVAWMLASLLVLHIGRRLGLSATAATVAGLIAAASPVAWIPVFWASASAEIYAVLLSLCALALWTRPGTPSLIGVVALGSASFLTKESALALPLVLALYATARLPGARRRAAPAATALLVLGLVALLAGWLTWRVLDPRSPISPYSLGGPRVMLLNLGVLGAWLGSPGPFPPAGRPWLPAAGAVLWTAWTLFALLAARRGDRRPLWCLATALLLTAPPLLLARHLQPYYVLAAVPALAWTGGLLVDRFRPPSPAAGGSAPWGLFVLAAVLATVGFATTRHTLTARTEAGVLSHPLARRSAVAHGVQRLVDALPLQPGQTLAVLSATRRQWPEELPASVAQAVNSPVHAAIEGVRGLQTMVGPQVSVRWDSHLDGLRLDSLVLFDDGSYRLRFWGRVRNARLYSALVAVAGGQHQRALHDLWVVDAAGGTHHEFVYDPDLLPIDPTLLDAESPAFVRHVLAQEDGPEARRILLLYRQLYEAVRGRPLPVRTD
jgi:hypothetical protein